MVVLRGHLSRYLWLYDQVTKPQVNSDESCPTVPPPSHAKQIQRRLDVTAQAAVVTEFQAGATIRALAAKHQVHRTTVSAILQRAGVPARQRGLRPEQISEAVELYAKGWSTADLGKRYNVTDMTVRARLIEAGVSMRKPGRPRKRS